MSNYVPGLLFEYERYHADAKVRIYADECLVDEFDLDNHISPRWVQICKTKTAGVEFNRTHTISLPEKLFLYHVSPKFLNGDCLLYTSPSPRDQRGSRMPSSA